MVSTELSLPAQLEAILYLKGRCLSLAELSELAGCERDEVELALITLMADYAHRDTALESAKKAPATACSCAKTWRLWFRSWCLWT